MSLGGPKRAANRFSFLRMSEEQLLGHRPAVAPLAAARIVRSPQSKATPRPTINVSFQFIAKMGDGGRENGGGWPVAHLQLTITEIR
jgi:hypothetical protein